MLRQPPRSAVRYTLAPLLIAIAVIALTMARATPASAAPLAQSEGACQSVGWRQITGPQGTFSALAGDASADRVYVGSRNIDEPDRITLYTGGANATTWEPVAELRGIRVTDITMTPSGPTDTWVSTFGYGDDFDGQVFGRAGNATFSPRGTMRSWYMQLASSTSGVFVAVSKPGDKGIYKWDEGSADWVLVGGDTIPTDYFRQFAAGINDRLWLGTDRQGLWVSDDDGVTWTPSRGANETVWSLAVSSADPNRVMVGLGPPNDGAATYPRGIRVTDDGGQSWTDVRSPGVADAQIVTALAFSELSSDYAVAAAWDGGMYASNDFGVNWLPATPPLDQAGFFNSFLTLIPRGPTRCELLYGAGANGVWVRNLIQPANHVYVPLASRSADLSALPEVEPSSE